MTWPKSSFGKADRSNVIRVGAFSYEPRLYREGRSVSEQSEFVGFVYSGGGVEDF